MLSKSRCPYTGVVNFFTDTDPLLSVGSVAKTGTASDHGLYVWRCYLGEETGGRVGDMSLAEARLRVAIARGQPKRGSSQRRNSEPALPSRAAAHWQKLNDAGCWRS